MVGTLTAAYMTPLVALYLYRWGMMPADAQEAMSVEHGVGFAIGLTGMSLCEGIVRWVKRWKEAPYWPGPPPPRGPA